MDPLSSVGSSLTKLYMMGEGDYSSGKTGICRKTSVPFPVLTRVKLVVKLGRLELLVPLPQATQSSSGNLAG